MENGVMADPFPVSPLDHPVSELDYKPVSAVSVAALIVSGLFVLIVVITAISAFVSKRPALNWEILLIAVLGLGLSIAGRLHVRRSEETRTGLRLATIAWWLSVLGGVIFAAYYGGSRFALWNQSEKAAEDWFDALKKQDFDRAFLATIPPLHRQGINPRNATDIEARFGAGAQAFRSSELVRFFQRNGEGVVVEPRGMARLEQIDNGYRLQLACRLTSPEGVFDLTPVLTGSEGKNFNGRDWQISTDGNLIARSRTTYGRLVQELQNEARFFADGWLRAVQSKMREPVLRAVFRADQQVELNKLLDQKQCAVALLGGLAIANIDQALWPATFDDLMARPFFNLDGQQLLDEEKKKVFRNAWRLGAIFLAGQSPLRLQSHERNSQISVTDKGIACTVLIDMSLPNGAGPGTKGKLVLECDSPEFFKELQEMKVKGKDRPETADETGSELLPSRPVRHWRVVRLESSLEPAQPVRTGPQ
jgi:hypothetical protein